MTDDGAALLAAILNNPAEDTPRLVYADWLDENGQGARAHFIRWQCDPAEGYRRGVSLVNPRFRVFEGWRLEAYPLCIAGNPDRELVAIDLAKLLPDPSGISSGRCRVHRGFIREVHYSADDWLTHADAILAAHPIERVTFPLFTVEIDPPGVDHGWQMYYYEPGREDYFSMSGGLETRDEMIAKLMDDIRHLEAELS